MTILGIEFLLGVMNVLELDSSDGCEYIKRKNNKKFNILKRIIL